MKIKFLIIIAIVLLLVACNKSNKNERSAQIEKSIQQANVEKEQLILRAKSDSAFAKSEAFAMAIERINIEQAQQMAKLNTPEHLLIAYENELKVLSSISNKLSKDASLSKNKTFMQSFEKQATIVRELYQKLNKMELSSSEKVRFDNLNTSP
jgi:hypothetical protein